VCANGSADAWAELDGPGTGAQRVLGTAGIDEIQPKALMGSGCLGPIGRGVGNSGGILGKGDGPLGITGGMGCGRRAQRQLHPVDGGDAGRVGHALPQLERADEVAQRFGGGEDRRRLLGRPHRRSQGADQVVALQTVVGKLGRSAIGGGEHPGVGGMQPYLLAGQQVGVDRLLQQRMAEHVGPGGLVGHQYAGRDRFTQSRLQVGLGPFSDLGEQRVGYPAAGHRRDPKHLLGRLR
jgi:hypothetical protein